MMMIRRLWTSAALGISLPEVACGEIVEFYFYFWLILKYPEGERFGITGFA